MFLSFLEMRRSFFAKYLITEVDISACCRELRDCAANAGSGERVNHRLASSSLCSLPLSLLSLDHRVREAGVGLRVWLMWLQKFFRLLWARQPGARRRRWGGGSGGWTRGALGAGHRGMKPPGSPGDWLLSSLCVYWNSSPWRQVFLKEALEQKLEKDREEELRKAAIVIRAHVLGYMARSVLGAAPPSLCFCAWVALTPCFAL